MPQPPKVSLIVVAAGRGARLGGDEPKQYRLCAGRPLLCHTLEALAAAHDFCATTIVIHSDDRARYDKVLAALSPACAASLGPPALGGATRQASVLAGLEAQAAQAPDLVLIHDGARAFPSKPLVERAIAAAAHYGAAAPGVRLSDTIKEVDDADLVVATPSRAALRAVQTPQSFRFDLILAAHRRAALENVEGLTDDAAVAEWAGRRSHIFDGDPDNVKVTTLQDLIRAEARLFNQAADVRVGQGFDVHAFVAGDRVWLGGVRIPHSQALSGHSDADVALHAITDALLGAIGDGDIGAHFPPSDPQWKGADSRVFLEDAIRRVRALNGIVAHIDATLVCEAPKIGPFREAMRTRIAEIVGIDVSRVGVKATTSERLGFTGRGEGIACMASATVRLPWRGEA
ncbi:bifunctional 2-C-methyl-D-erythritol 4-phosphate cytidylyltransferase/2-C-methyl-D-erythritol 2,4-cyclodiphosphate synthase [Methylocapsa sp. S129]|uniref:bifunctional 2-C-methyl-D-erythritol 4-phosphate cytidylyltransferase/2-C-methyl-D-erythritol 2,4-cyclodiphosphate synthase n=1 Tax=Methylocapsa sp. S129 TaxID=1641869 RepID=UPI00131B88B6|nr:bifunctional 2-C-methyl-D-erythritol 4-phosphate cytidylyltransferase/2-C-methyl-D-erythritol 2,4-cyclodiphosphate synthase [Methylocapsa sp. S129]